MLRFSTPGGLPGLVKVGASGLKLDCKSSRVLLLDVKATVMVVLKFIARCPVSPFYNHLYDVKPLGISGTKLAISGTKLASPVPNWQNFSPFFSGCISFAKSALSFGSSLDRRVDMNNGACEASWTGHPLSSISLTNTSITCKAKLTINHRFSTFVREILSSAGD